MKPVAANFATTEIETALQIGPGEAWTRRSISGYDRIYFGHELCERLLPAPQQLRRLIAVVRKAGCAFSLLTPSVTELGLRDVLKLVSLLDDEDEVVVNDYGVLHKLHKEFPQRPVIGRILGRIVIPAVVAVQGQDILWNAYWSSLGHRVRRVEVDGLNAGLIEGSITQRISVSLYTGPTIWTTTRRCAFNARAGHLSKFRMCRRECLKSRAVIKNVAAGKDFILNGNAILDAQEGRFTTVPGVVFDRQVVVRG